MWILWKKVLGSVAVVALASVFGYRLLPGHAADPTRNLPALNEEMQSLLMQTPSAGTGDSFTPGPAKPPAVGFARAAVPTPGLGGVGSLGGAAAVTPATELHAAERASASGSPIPGVSAPASGSLIVGVSTPASGPPVAKASASAKSQRQGEASAKPVGKVDLNHASLQELVSLPGIGESKAAAIIAYRDKHGGFRSAGEIVNVKGIGPKTYEALKDRIEVVLFSP